MPPASRTPPPASCILDPAVHSVVRPPASRTPPSPVSSITAHGIGVHLGRLAGKPAVSPSAQAVTASPQRALFTSLTVPPSSSSPRFKAPPPRFSLVTSQQPVAWAPACARPQVVPSCCSSGHVPKSDHMALRLNALRPLPVALRTKPNILGEAFKTLVIHRPSAPRPHLLPLREP